jgi:dihydrofolate reductase
MNMRQIIAFNRVSADGYFAGENGSLDWVIPDEQIDREAAQSAERGSNDTILFGRRTYDMFESFWPKALDDAGKIAANPHDNRPSEAMGAMAIFINNAGKIVFSKTKKAVTWKNSRLVREFNPREIEDLKKQPGKDILIFGSSSIVSQLTEHRLIDEYRFIVGPVLLGRGRLLIHDVPTSVKLDLLEAKTYASGNVMMRYAHAM